MIEENYEFIFGINQDSLEKSEILRDKEDPSVFVHLRRLEKSDSRLYQIYLKNLFQRKKFDHPHIVELIKVNLNPKMKTIESYFEHSPYNLDFIQFDNFDGIVQCTRDILSGLDYFMEMDYEHGTLNSKSICYFSKNKVFKLENRRQLHLPVLELQQQNYKKDELTGLSPETFELLSAEKVDKEELNVFKNDVFSLGVIILNLIYPDKLNANRFYDKKFNFFYKEKFITLLNEMVECEKDFLKKEFVKLLIKKMVNTDVNERADPCEALEHVDGYIETYFDGYSQLKTKLKLKRNSVYSRSTKKHFLAISSDQFRVEEEINIGIDDNKSRSSNLSNYIKKHSIEMQKSLVENSQRSDREKNEREVNSNSMRKISSKSKNLIGFISEIGHESENEQSVHYESTNDNKPVKSLNDMDISDRTITVLSNRKSKENPLIDIEKEDYASHTNNVGTEKKQLSNSGLLKEKRQNISKEDDIILEIKIKSNTHQNMHERGSEYDVIEISNIEDLNLRFDSKLKDRVELIYNMREQGESDQVKKINETKSLSYTPLRLRICNFTNLKTVKNPLNNYSFHNQAEESSITLKNTNDKNKISHFESQKERVSNLNTKPVESKQNRQNTSGNSYKVDKNRIGASSNERLMKSYIHVPRSFKERMASYRSKQKIQRLSKSTKIHSINETNRKYAVLDSKDKKRRNIIDLKRYRENSFSARKD